MNLTHLVKLKREMSKNNQKVPMVAIEYSEKNEVLPISSQPHPPRNLQDLLRYSTEASTALGGRVATNSCMPLDDESKKFLEEALKSMTVDVIEELLKHINTLQNANLIPEDADPSECEAALDHIFDIVDNLDVANDFHKVGGFSVVKPCLESVHSSLRWRGAELVAELSQNNPYCQEKILDTELMSYLLRMVDMDVDDTVRVKALYAVSCLVRENEEGYKEFMKNDGFSVLLRALQTDVRKLNIKSAFLLSSLCHWKPQVKDSLVSMGYVEQLISQLAAHSQLNKEEHLPCLGHLLNAILDIVRDHAPAQEIARRPVLQFKSLLDCIVKISEGNDQYREENDHAKDIIRIVFEESENGDEER